MRPRRGSLRLWMTLWNVAALAAVLIAFGLGFRFLLWKVLVQSLDAEMAGQVGRLTRRWEDAPRERKRVLLFLLRTRPAAVTSLLPEGAEGAAQLLSGIDAGPEGVPTYPGRILDTSRHSYLSSDPMEPWDTSCYQRSLKGDTCHTTVHTPEGDTIRVCSIPIREESGAVEGVAQTARSLHPTEQTIQMTDRILLAFLPLALLTAGAVGTLLTTRALAPVGRLSNAAGRIGARDLSERLPVEGADEFASLAQVINGMLERLARAFEQQQRFTADASHELRSPLTVILGQASLALGRSQSPENQHAWERTARAARTMERLVRDLLLLARSDAQQLEIERTSLRVRDLLEAAVETVPDTDRTGRAPIQIHCPADLRVEGDAPHLERALQNLLTNSLRHTPSSGNIALTATGNDPAWVTITVADTGSGIAPEHLPHVMERFYRVDQGRSRAAGGTGIGLAIARSIVAAHGGALTLESQVGQGTTVTLSLPRTDKAIAS